MKQFLKQKMKTESVFYVVILKRNIHVFICIKYFGTDTQETLNNNYLSGEKPRSGIEQKLFTVYSKCWNILGMN